MAIAWLYDIGNGSAGYADHYQGTSDSLERTGGYLAEFRSSVATS